MRVVPAVVAALVLKPAVAADPVPMDPARIADVLAAEVAAQRAALSIQGAPPFYHLRYHAFLLDQASATASFGALVEEEHHPTHLLGIEVRLGDPAFDVVSLPAPLDRVRGLCCEVVVRPSPSANRTAPLYVPVGEAPARRENVTLIPYFAWNNRGEPHMRVWLPLAN